MKLLRILGLALGCVLTLAVLLYIIGVAINWSDAPPSADAQRMHDLYANRPAVPDAQNAFVYTMGFAASDGADPQEQGVQLVAWLEAHRQDSSVVQPDLGEQVDYDADRSELMETLRSICRDGHSTECRDAFETAASGLVPSSAEVLQLSRYRELLQRTAWREVVALDLRKPIARMGDMFGGQSLYMIEIGQRAREGDVAGVKQALGRDIRFWREVQESSAYLITKMFAVSALRQHFYFGSLVLRQLPPGHALAAMPDEWSVEFTRDERSMLRAMAGELAYSQVAMREWKNATEWHARHEEEAESSSFLSRTTQALLRPYYQPQDQANHFATRFLEFARRFDVPLDQYLSAADAGRAGNGQDFSLHVYNLTGHVFRGITETSSYIDYPLRVGSLEGNRRAALLTTQLRARVPRENMPAELNGAALRNPFDNAAFEWSSGEAAVIFQSPVKGARSRNAYFY